MDTKELAATLNGRQIGDEVPKTLEAIAKDAGLVIVFGASDDLVEFRGAIDDEAGAYQGVEVQVDQYGIVPDFDALISDRGYDIKDKLRDYFHRENSGASIEALWDSEKPYSWTFKTDIPHETFEILEDGAPFCRGIVFSLADVAPLKLTEPT